MTDNVNVPDLVTGVKVASDDIGGVQYQRIKLDAGADGVSAPVTTATPLPVTLPAAQVPPANTGYSTDAKLDTVVTALQNLLTELQLKADLSETQPASLASVPSHEVTGPLTDTELRATAVSVTGTVTANTGLDQPLTDTQLRASAVPTSLASVPSHPVTTVDGGNAVLGATTDAAIVTDTTGTIKGALRGLIKLILDKITVKLDAGTALIGKVSIDQVTANANEVVVKSITAGDNNIGNVDVASLPVDGDNSIGTVKLMIYDGGAEAFVPVQAGPYGSVFAQIVGIDSGIFDRTDGVYLADNTLVVPKYAVISASSSGNNTIVAAVANKKIRVLALTLTFSAGVSAKFQSAASGTDKTGLIYGVTGVPFILPYNKLGWFETAASALLNLNLSAAVAVGGCLTYIEV
jgi:hypothetical protein